MIVFDLKCHKDHVFEAWFKDSGAYERQRKRGLVTCTICGSVKVEKAPMAPRISTGKGRAAAPPPEAAPAQGGAEPTAMVGLADNPAAAKAAAMLQQLGELRAFVEKTCDYVGPQFAEEARKMHYGEKDRRNIYGEANDKEARELADEGIEVNRVPWLPRRDA